MSCRRDAERIMCKELSLQLCSEISLLVNMNFRENTEASGPDQVALTSSTLKEELSSSWLPQKLPQLDRANSSKTTPMSNGAVNIKTWLFWVTALRNTKGLF